MLGDKSKAYGKRIKCNLTVRQYPSGMSVNSLLSAKCFNVHENHIVIGNGAAESIKALLEELDGSIGIIRPTFEEYPNLYIIKSISKSYGVPGLRLGILAGSNTEKIDKIKKRVLIWNINSMAEFFMQILDKYKNDYMISLARLKEERKRFGIELSTIEGLRVYPSEANYLCVNCWMDIIVQNLPGNYWKISKSSNMSTGKQKSPHFSGD